MLAISDGGSTKGDWRIIDNNGEVKGLTITGFNPNYDSTHRIAKILQAELAEHVSMFDGGKIYYYGSGCWDPGRKKLVAQAFSTVFPKGEIHVLHDLLAAARATCGVEPGIACILGTGSNSVLYDGKDEIDNVTNLGFLLGDEGSGSMIGKELVRAYFYREMPKELRTVMDAACANGRQEILDKIYAGGVPAAYLASFAGLFSKHREHPFVRNLIKSCFDEFLVRHVYKYDGFRELPIHFIGSIAYHFNDILKTSLKEHHLEMGVVLQKPIDELVKYHLKYLDQPNVVSNPASSPKTS